MEDGASVGDIDGEYVGPREGSSEGV